MQLNNIITNTKPVADSFVNDQLKWRRERIEKLTKERNLYKKAYEQECEYVRTLSELVNFMITDMENVVGTLPHAEKLKETLEKHIKEQKDGTKNSNTKD
jgi:hypothetical protein